MPFDDDGAHVPDAHGKAAMLLVESLIHALIANKILTEAEAVAIVEVATEVEADAGHDLGCASGTNPKALGLLNAISISLLPRGGSQ